MTYVGLDPERAEELASHLDEAAADLDAHAYAVERLLLNAGISSSNAPAELREVAGWAAYRSRDLRRRIERIRAADHIGAGPRLPGFRFDGKKGAVRAADEAVDKLRGLVGKENKKALLDELRAIEPYLADERYLAEFFKRLGPKLTFRLMLAARGTNELLILGRALAAAQAPGYVTRRFVGQFVEAALKAEAARNAYVHAWGGETAEERVRNRFEEWEHDASGPPGLWKFMKAIEPLTPYLEAGAKVAVVGGAVVIVTGAGACVVLSEGSCLGPTSAFVEEAVVLFSTESPTVPTGLFETLPLSLENEATFTSFIDKFRAALPQAQLIFRGSSATGVSYKTGEPFRADSDIDLAIVDDGLFAKARQMGLQLWGGGNRTPPLAPDDPALEDLGLTELQRQLTDIAGHDVSIMIYRSMDDVLARGPGIVVPTP